MTALTGMKEICAHMQKAESTILAMIRDLGFPAIKMTGKIWESDTELITQWRRDTILNGKTPVKSIETETIIRHKKPRQRNR